MKSIVALFTDKKSAGNAVSSLYGRGLARNKISVIYKDLVVDKKIGTISRRERFFEGFASGAATGAITGGILWLISGLFRVDFPYIGMLSAGNQFTQLLGLSDAAAATVTGTLLGIAPGGIFGALVSIGLPMHKLELVDNKLGDSNVLVTIESEDDNAETIGLILQKNNAVHLSSFTLG